MAPLLIFPGQRFSYDPLEGFPEAHLARSSNGWIDAEIFEGWLLHAFVPAVSHLPKPVLLFADGHKAHNTMTVHDICKEHGIIFYSLPSHASHVVQPLDLTTFKKLKQSWREELGPSRLYGQTDRTHNPDRTDSSPVTLSSSFLEELVDTDPIVATDCTIASTDDLPGGKFDIDQPSTSTALPDNDITLPSPRRSPDEQTVTHSREICLNMLLDLTAKLGPDKLVTMRIMYKLQETTDDPETNHFFKLYGTMLGHIHKDDETQTRTFDNLPLPSRWNKKKRNVLEPPKMISSDKFKEFKEAIENKKKTLEKEKERKREEREKKKKEAEATKQQNLEKKKKGGTKKRKLEEQERDGCKQQKNIGKASKSEPKKKTSNEGKMSKSKIDTDEDVYSSHNNVNCFEFDPDVCCGCGGDKDGMYEEWVGCECGRWFHVLCTQDESVIGKDVDELEELTFVCLYCH
ncbi:Jerky protein [Plakobranchus ocellatus]|uniref:Jerky protein n=1 Tax=Plakobranchus ocellatus TaxID=259542 RepID=A0AAV3ZDB0_9GAST|nr:Jerky protein [Plakobranchus ocellatus]